MSIKRIAADLDVAVSSVSVWVRDIVPPTLAPRPPASPPVEVQHSPGAPTRRCSRCEADLPLAAFNRNRDGHQHYCRDCFRAYFRDRGDRHREQSREARARRQAVGRASLREHLAEHPCVDCGEGDLAVLEFDHPGDDKESDVARLLTTGALLPRLRAEIGRCEVVCVNCHRRRTAARARTFRVTGVAPASWPSSRRRNAAFVVEVLRLTGCVDCGERDPVVLDFDHVGPKRASVAHLVRDHGLAALRKEIAQCVVRCANCHRIRTLIDCGAWRAEDHWARALHDRD